MPQYQHIRDICARVLTANGDEQMRATLTELKIALHDQPGSADDLRIGPLEDLPAPQTGS